MKNIAESIVETQDDHYVKHKNGAGWVGYQHSTCNGYLNNMSSSNRLKWKELKMLSPAREHWKHARNTYMETVSGGCQILPEQPEFKTIHLFFAWEWRNEAIENSIDFDLSNIFVHIRGKRFVFIRFSHELHRAPSGNTKYVEQRHDRDGRTSPNQARPIFVSVKPSH